MDPTSYTTPNKPALTMAGRFGNSQPASLIFQYFKLPLHWEILEFPLAVQAHHLCLFVFIYIHHRVWSHV